MKDRSFNLLEIAKAQFSNRSAEKCKDMKTGTMVIIIIALIFISAFPYINQRVITGLRNSDASEYPGLGSALIKAARESGGFSVKNSELIFRDDEPVYDFGEWKVVFTEKDAEQYFKSCKDFKPYSMIIFSRKSLLINCVETSKTVNASYASFPGFSSEEILKAAKDKESMVLYIRALLFSMSTSQIPSAILMMILLITVQVTLFIFAMSLLLSHSKKNGWDKKDSAVRYGFMSSAKIITAVAVLPCFVVSGVSYFNPSFGLSLGWVLYSFILGLRVVIIYISRVKGRDTRPVV